MFRSLFTLAAAGIILITATARADKTSAASIGQIIGDTTNKSLEQRRVLAILERPISKVNFDKLDITDVVDFLRKQSKEIDPQHVGVKFRLVWPAAGKVSFPGDKTHWMYLHREVSITLDNVPIVELLDYIASQTNLQFCVQEEVIFAPDITPFIHQTDQPERSSFTVQPGDPYDPGYILVAFKLRSIFIPKVHFDKTDIQAFLNAVTLQSKKFDPLKEGLQFRLDWPSTDAAVKSLKLHRPISIDRDNIWLDDLLSNVCLQTHLEYKIEKGVIVFSMKPVEEKLASIVIPKIRFEKEDISDAIDFLSKQSKELDPKHVGFKFDLGWPSGTYLHPPKIQRPVTLTLDNAPLDEILRFICEQTNLYYAFTDSDLIFLYPRTLDPISQTNR